MMSEAARILNFLKRGIPPEDPRSIHISTRSNKRSITKILVEIKEAINESDLRLLAIVGPRGIGKTHIMKLLNADAFDKEGIISTYIRAMPPSPIDFVKDLVKELGREFFKNLINELIEESQSLSEVFQRLFDISGSYDLSVALTKITDSTESDLVWKWLIDRIGRSELGKIYLEEKKISKNMQEKDAISLFKGVIDIICDISGKGFCILIDEVDDISALTPKYKKLLKRFLVKLINEDWNSGVFIGLGCTDAAWRELYKDPYSQKSGLSRRLSKVELFQFDSKNDAKKIVEKILELVSERYDQDLSNIFDDEKIEKIYEEELYYPGRIVKRVVEICEEHLLIEPNEKKTTIESRIEKLEAEGREVWEDHYTH